jgi:hypothetical protein
MQGWNFAIHSTAVLHADFLKIAVEHRDRRYWWLSLQCSKKFCSVKFQPCRILPVSNVMVYDIFSATLHHVAPLLRWCLSCSSTKWGTKYLSQGMSTVIDSFFPRWVENAHSDDIKKTKTGWIDSHSKIITKHWDGNFKVLQLTDHRLQTCLEGCQAFQLHGDLYTLYFFSLFWGHVFFAFQHNLATFCRGKLLKLVWISVAKILSKSLILLFPHENHTFGISGINLCHLGAELSILMCRKRFRGVNCPRLPL